jgi:hypothetical protein
MTNSEKSLKTQVLNRHLGYSAEDSWGHSGRKIKRTEYGGNSLES